MGNITSWFRGIKGKLLFAAALPIVAFCMVGVISVNGVGRVNELLKSSHNEIIPNILILTDMRISRNAFGFRAYSALSLFKAGKDIDGELVMAEQALDSYRKDYEKYTKTPFTAEEKALFDKAQDKFPAILAIMEDILKNLKAKDAAGLEKAEELLRGDYTVAGVPVSEFTAAALKIYEGKAMAEGELAHQAEQSVKMWNILTTIIGNILISGTLLWIASRMSKEISGISEQLTDASNHVAGAVTQMTSAGTSLSQSSTEAAASLEETVASLEELSSMVQMNSDNAKQAASLSASSRDVAEKGQSEISKLISSMEQISGSSRKIEEIIHVIDDIAFQTNLLALNAAVEAARAGEQGKGFAVVAEAVRALAQRSASAAKDITQLIKQSVQQVEEGSQIASSSGMVLDNIVTSVKKVSDLNNEIATASTEQTAGIQQISKAMNQLDQAAQSNAASAEEIAASSAEIDSMAATSQKLTSQLNEVIHGKGGVTAVAPAAAPASLGKAPVVKASQASKVPPKKVAKQSAASDVIPFDDERQVGTIEGF
ncbi:HAMP domain-containing methyl-accepting chemotaxis protein [Bdellovibrio bacteriovorus]|uniref:Putative methyl-accepting chemotaxis protein n=1 Tax=Bdellovibrio bacteriovorus str. Tiberius TaxID=1069642 RepID=K7ZC03_BDEBC|nr:methyl-accepting chemotaxis protein [Bdellovibrio bacteriovorus]AFY02779.1 putative methyl-accepting chemotaxis protein [Bdellovibrio bacteriovorus str. Tiberius]